MTSTGSYPKEASPLGPGYVSAIGGFPFHLRPCLAGASANRSDDEGSVSRYRRSSGNRRFQCVPALSRSSSCHTLSALSRESDMVAGTGGTEGSGRLYIEPGSPWENGYGESFNGKLRDECLNGEIFYSLQEAQIVMEQWREEYNTRRPHSALGYNRPPVPGAYNPFLLPKPGSRPQAMM